MASTHSSVQSIDRVFDIVEALSSVPQGMKLSDLASAINLHISTAHRLVTSLSELGYARKDPASGKYRLTLRMFEIGSRVSDVLSLLPVSKQFLDELANTSQEAVHLVERDGDDVVYLYKSEPYQHMVRMASSVGWHNPMYCTGVGKSILAFLSPQEIKDIWNRTDIRPYTEHTFTDLPALEEELAKIRKVGYALDNEEHDYGVRCVAAPIFNCNGLPVGAVSVSAPISRIDDVVIERIYPQLLALTREISRILGYTGNLPHLL